MSRVHFIVLILILNLAGRSVQADDCQSSLYSLENALPKVKLPFTGLNLDTATKTDFCFDPKKEFEELKKDKIFNEENCADPEKVSADERIRLTSFMLKVMEKTPLNLYSLTPAGVSDLNYSPKKLVFSNVTNEKQVFNFKEANKLTTSDTLTLGGATIGSVFVGTLMSRQIYKGS